MSWKECENERVVLAFNWYDHDTDMMLFLHSIVARLRKSSCAFSSLDT